MLGNIVAGTFSAGAPPIPPTSYESIATVTVGSGGTSTIDFTSIPSTYKHLQLRIIARGTNASNAINMPFTFNNDTASNYRTHILYSEGSGTPASFEYGSIGAIYLDYMPAASRAANIFGAAVIDILDYASTSKNKTLRYLQGIDANGSGYMNFFSGLWNSTSAINRITFSVALAEHSSFALYGIRD
jgi:hypothetical protein